MYTLKKEEGEGQTGKYENLEHYGGERLCARRGREDERTRGGGIEAEPLRHSGTISNHWKRGKGEGGGGGGGGEDDEEQAKE